MNRWWEKYQRFLGAVFLLWFLLRTGQFFGFSFGVDLHLLFRVVLFLGGIWGIWGIWRNWDSIFPVLKGFFVRQKREFSVKTKAAQAKIVAFSPKILGGRAGSLAVLPLAVAVGVFGELGELGGKLPRILFSKEGILVLGILGILGDVFVFDFSSDLMILFLTGLWLWSVRRYRLEGRVSVGVALFFLAMCPFLLIFKKDPIAEKAAIWAYMFLVVGVGQLFTENLKR